MLHGQLLMLPLSVHKDAKRLIRSVIYVLCDLYMCAPLRRREGERRVCILLGLWTYSLRPSAFRADGS
jgi:hypothetical protein